MKVFNHNSALIQDFRVSENYEDIKSLTIPDRSQGISDIIARSVNGASSNYFRQVEYDGDHVDIERTDLIDDPDFSYCDIGSATEKYKDLQTQLHEKSIDLTNATTTNSNDDDAVK